MPPMPSPATKRGDVDPEIVEDDDDRDREQSDADQHADDRHGVAERGFAGMLADAAADRAEDQLARPDRALERGGDDEQDVGERARPSAAHRRRLTTMSIAAAIMKRMLVRASTRPTTPCQVIRSGSRATIFSPIQRRISMSADEARGDQRAEHQAVGVGGEPVDERSAVMATRHGGHGARAADQARRSASLRARLLLREELEQADFGGGQPTCAPRGRFIPRKRIARVGP